MQAIKSFSFVVTTNACVLHRENSAIVDSSVISRQIKELSDTIDNAKQQMAKTKHAMRLVERSLNASYQLIKAFETVCHATLFGYNELHKIFRPL